MIHLIAAIGKRGQLGLDGKLPWHDPNDLRWFREMTMGQVCVVGHRTAATLPPLPGRELVVCTGNPLDAVCSIGDRDIWVIGGAKTYALWLPYVGRLHINVIDYNGPADTWMPALVPGEVAQLVHSAADE